MSNIDFYVFFLSQLLAIVGQMSSIIIYYFIY